MSTYIEYVPKPIRSPYRRWLVRLFAVVVTVGACVGVYRQVDTFNTVTVAQYCAANQATTREALKAYRDSWTVVAMTQVADNLYVNVDEIRWKHLPEHGRVSLTIFAYCTMPPWLDGKVYVRGEHNGTPLASMYRGHYFGIW